MLHTLNEPLPAAKSGVSDRTGSFDEAGDVMKITPFQEYHPTRIEDLSKFVLIGREKLTAIRAEIRAIEKLELAEEVRRQKLEEAQFISEAVLDAEVRIGSLMSRMPKAQGLRSDLEHTDSGDAKSDKTKAESIRELGFTSKQAERFETLAKHGDIVESAKAEARENDDIISRSFVLQKIKESKNPHVIQNSNNNEGYTPMEYIAAARKVMGDIDLDPASSDIANGLIHARKYYTAYDNGLLFKWHGRIWLNPPYSSALLPLFIEKLKTELADGRTTEAIVLVNNATETAWFHMLVSIANAIVFPKGRVKYYIPGKKTDAPLQGQAVIYIGDKPRLFMEVFGSFGWGSIIVT
jgi:ParB family chromosome partitioning protein